MEPGFYFLTMMDETSIDTIANDHGFEVPSLPNAFGYVSKEKYTDLEARSNTVFYVYDPRELDGVFEYLDEGAEVEMVFRNHLKIAYMSVDAQTGLPNSTIYMTQRDWNAIAKKPGRFRSFLEAAKVYAVFDTDAEKFRVDVIDNPKDAVDTLKQTK